MSPFCSGLLLSDCQSAAAGELRAEIRARLEAGESEGEIVDDLVARFGPGVRGRPEPRGLGLLLWVVPLGVGAATLVAVVWRVRTSISRVNDTGPGAMPEDPLIAARLDEELYAVD